MWRHQVWPQIIRIVQNVFVSALESGNMEAAMGRNVQSQSEDYGYWIVVSGLFEQTIKWTDFEYSSLWTCVAHSKYTGAILC